jgi:dephospho-CoA kinase
MENTKIILGLTGNIATGKSVIRRMLENFGALGIDADLIAHRTLYPDGAAHQPVLDAFGDSILTTDGSISRHALADIVFNDPVKLAQLEALIHPAVTAAIQARITRTSAPLIVIEAIKLLESELAEVCDVIWVSDTTKEIQLERLLQFRHMKLVDAQQRIAAQPSQEEKRSRANIIINTNDAYSQTWGQIREALNDTIQLSDGFEYETSVPGNSWQIKPAGWLDPSMLSKFWDAQRTMGKPDLYETLAFKTLAPMLSEDTLMKLLLWDNWNFTGTLQAVLPPHRAEETFPPVKLLSAFYERRLWELIIVPDDIEAQIQPLMLDHGFQHRTACNIAYRAWHDALMRQTLNTEKPVWVKVFAEPIEKMHPIHQTK